MVKDAIQIAVQGEILPIGFDDLAHRVEFFDQDGRITGFCCQGHSGYAEEGADIVCAAVTTAIRMAECTINDVCGSRAKTRVNDEEARITLHLPAK